MNICIYLAFDRKLSIPFFLCFIFVVRIGFRLPFANILTSSMYTSFFSFYWNLLFCILRLSQLRILCGVWSRPSNSRCHLCLLFDNIFFCANLLLHSLAFVSSLIDFMFILPLRSVLALPLIAFSTSLCRVVVNPINELDPILAYVRLKYIEYALSVWICMFALSSIVFKCDLTSSLMRYNYCFYCNNSRITSF